MIFPILYLLADGILAITCDDLETHRGLRLRYARSREAAGLLVREAIAVKDTDEEVGRVFEELVAQARELPSAAPDLDYTGPGIKSLLALYDLAEDIAHGESGSAVLHMPEVPVRRILGGFSPMEPVGICAWIDDEGAHAAMLFSQAQVADFLEERTWATDPATHGMLVEMRRRKLPHTALQDTITFSGEAARLLLGCIERGQGGAPVALH